MKWAAFLKWGFFALMVAAVYFLATADVVHAQSPDNRPPDNRPPGHDGGGVDTNTFTGGTNTFNGGDVSVPVNVSGGDLAVSHSSKAFALSNVLGDVDIAGCLGSTQWATPIYSKQKLQLNWPCMAEFYLRNQKYDLAAMAICNTEVLSEFENEAECEAAHDFAPVMVEVEADLSGEVIESFDSEQQVQDDSIVTVQMAQADLYDRVAALENKPAPAPAPRQAAQQAEPEPRYTDADKAYILSLYSEGENEDE